MHKRSVAPALTAAVCAAAIGVLFALAAPWASAQTPAMPGPAQAAPGTPPDSQPMVPLNNPRNRNPARRANPDVPDLLPPPDPRDSSTRPALPPGTPDPEGRDTLLSPPAGAAPAGSVPAKARR